MDAKVERCKLSACFALCIKGETRLPEFSIPSINLSLSLQCGGLGGKSNSHREDGEGAMVASRSSLANCCLLVLISFCVLRLWDRIDYGTLTLILPLANTTAAGGVKDAVDRGAGRRNYIVRFFEYKDAADHRAYLQGKIELDGWEWIERQNPASKFPTDFGLVAIDDLVRTAVIEALERLELVKDVSADLSYSRSALSEEAGRVGAFVDGKKRPGKIFSSMSYSERDYYATAISNSSISWNRHLLMQARIFQERRITTSNLDLLFYLIST